MRNRGQNLGYQEEKKICLNLENREEKEKLFFKILTIESVINKEIQMTRKGEKLTRKS